MPMSPLRHVCAECLEPLFWGHELYVFLGHPKFGLISPEKSAVGFVVCRRHIAPYEQEDDPAVLVKNAIFATNSSWIWPSRLAFVGHTLLDQPPAPTILQPWRYAPAALVRERFPETFFQVVLGLEAADGEGYLHNCMKEFLHS